MIFRALSLLPLAMLLLGCIDRQTAQRAIEGVQRAEGGVVPDVMPVMRNAALPFRYPPALYAARVQGNVTLRIFIDSAGAVWPESTSIVKSSGYSAFDSSAIEGSRELRFFPAMLHGRPMSISILLPVFFRHPEGRPLPGDTILRRSHPTP